MKVQLIPVTLFQANCVIVWDEETLDGVVFDPGGEPARIERFITDSKINIQAIYLTHGHVDHVSGTNKLKKALGVPVYLHDADLPLAARTAQQCAMFGIPGEEAPEVDRPVADGESHTIGSLTFDVLHTPGHSPGSCCYLFAAGDEPVLVAGDLLFAGSIGRMDLPGGDQDQMKASLETVAALPDNTVVIAGHGPRTTIGREKMQNPYLAGGLTAW